MIGMLIKAVAVVAVVAVVTGHGSAVLHPVRTVTAQAKAVAVSDFDAASARVSKAAARLKRTKQVKQLERLWTKGMAKVGIDG
jgi:hypothetical protein